MTRQIINEANTLDEMRWGRQVVLGRYSQTDLVTNQQICGKHLLFFSDIFRIPQVPEKDRLELYYYTYMHFFVTYCFDFRYVELNLPNYIYVCRFHLEKYGFYIIDIWYGFFKWRAYSLANIHASQLTLNFHFSTKQKFECKNDL